MSEPIWLTERLVIAIHQEQLRKFGGLAGLRDGGLLASALGRARNKWAYEGADLIACAASYAFGLARNHPFADGNKRVAFLSIIAFLGLNGVEFAPGKAEAVAAMLDLASGALTEEGLTQWIRDVIAGRRGSH